MNPRGAHASTLASRKTLQRFESIRTKRGAMEPLPSSPFVTTAMVVVVEPGTSEVSALAPLGASLLVELDEVSVFEH